MNIGDDVFVGLSVAAVMTVFFMLGSCTKEDSIETDCKTVGAVVLNARGYDCKLQPPAPKPSKQQ